jgi:hypothetical protein
MSHTKILSLRGDGFAGAACSISVKAPQLGPDLDLLPQDAREHATRGRALDAREAVARISAAPRFRATRHEDAAARREAKQLPLRRPPAAAGTAPKGSVGYDSSPAEPSSTSMGMPSVSSSSAAR